MSDKRSIDLAYEIIWGTSPLKDVHKALGEIIARENAELLKLRDTAPVTGDADWFKRYNENVREIGRAGYVGEEQPLVPRRDNPFGLSALDEYAVRGMGPQGFANLDAKTQGVTGAPEQAKAAGFGFVESDYFQKAGGYSPADYERQAHENDKHRAEAERRAALKAERRPPDVTADPSRFEFKTHSESYVEPPEVAAYFREKMAKRLEAYKSYTPDEPAAALMKGYRTADSDREYIDTVKWKARPIELRKGVKIHPCGANEGDTVMLRDCVCCTRAMKPKHAMFGQELKVTGRMERKDVGITLLQCEFVVEGGLRKGLTVRRWVPDDNRLKLVKRNSSASHAKT